MFLMSEVPLYVTPRMLTNHKMYSIIIQRRLVLFYLGPSLTRLCGRDLQLRRAGSRVRPKRCAKSSGQPLGLPRPEFGF